MVLHRIRLHGPWECRPLSQTHSVSLDLPFPCRITIPCRWSEGGLGDFSGKVEFRRRFQWPQSLEAHERLFLTFAGIADRAAVHLNGQFLGDHEGADEPFEFEITERVQARNELIVEVEGEINRGGIYGPVVLEVRNSTG